jgi:hypothetical protein
MSVTSNDNNVDEQFFKKAKEALEARAENLDEKVLSRLHQMRHKALQGGKEKKKIFSSKYRWVQAGALSTLVLAMTLLVIWLQNHRTTASFNNPEDFEIVSPKIR